LLVEGLLGLYQEQAIKPLYYEAASWPRTPGLMVY
jgi:hypothetical protein